MILPQSPFLFDFDFSTTTRYPATISVQGNSLALEDPLSFNLILEINNDFFSTQIGIIFNISRALVTIEDLDGKVLMYTTYTLINFYFIVM